MQAERETRDLVILGTAGNSLEILDCVIAATRAGLSPRYVVKGFLDDDAARHGTTLNGISVLGPLASAREMARQAADVVFINGIGSTTTYQRKPDIIAALGLPADRFATVIHPSATISGFAAIGAGSVIMQQVVVCSHVMVGAHVQVLPLTVLSHDVVVEDFATIAGGAAVSGFVRLGRACYVGSNASIRGGVTVGAGALIGMGAVVLEDVRPGATVVGVPAAEIARG